MRRVLFYGLHGDLSFENVRKELMLQPGVFGEMVLLNLKDVFFSPSNTLEHRPLLGKGYVGVASEVNLIVQWNNQIQI